MSRSRHARSASAARAGSLRAVLTSSGQFGVAAAILALAFLLGGGSRDDIISLVILRPLAVLAIGYGLYRQDIRTILKLGLPLWLLLALLLWAIVQVIPMPHDIWTALPGRELLAANDALLGLPNLARPISLVPSRTWNTIFALAVPLAVLVTSAGLDARERMRLLWVVFAAAVASVVLASLQMLGEPGGPLYFFRITNFNNPVGLFSNRNHLAIFLASVLPLAFYPAVASSGRHRQRTLWIAGAPAAALCLFVFVLATGSRSGALLFFAALLATTLLWFAVDYRIAATPGARRIQILRFGAAGVAVLAVTLFVLSSSRSAGVGRLLEESLGEDLRVQILPQLRAMLSAYFPTGIGFGAFEYAYEMFEPRALLRTTYLNQAHNDVLQFMIEGGVFATGIMVVFAFWFARAGVRAAQALLAARRSGTGLSVAPFAWLALAAVIGGSLGDYPLRTPALMAYVALLCCLLQRDARPG